MFSSKDNRISEVNNSDQQATINEERELKACCFINTASIANSIFYLYNPIFGYTPCGAVAFNVSVICVCGACAYCAGKVVAAPQKSLSAGAPELEEMNDGKPRTISSRHSNTI